MDSVLLRSRGTRLAVAGVATLVLAADQATKSAAVAANPHGSGNGSGLVSLRLVRNTGASFGIGSGHPLLITLTAAAILAVAVALLLRTSSRAVALSLAAVAGGAAGNLADRLFRAPGLGRGAVVDWIHVSFYPPTFNLADVAIRLGALIAVIAVIAAPRPGPSRIDRWRPANTTRHGAKLLGVVSDRIGSFARFPHAVPSPAARSFRAATIPGASHPSRSGAEAARRARGGLRDPHREHLVGWWLA